MFIEKINIKNYRPFTIDRACEIVGLNVPDEENPGSGLTCLVGENGCGKTAILNALALPMLEYKADDFDLKDLNDPSRDVCITITAKEPFRVKKMMRDEFMARGMCFEGRVRERVNKKYLSSITVGDQKFLPAGANAPEEDSPDLRLSVNNPFSGKRFDENDVLHLDKNRLFQVKSGNYNRTRFDRLMEGFDYQYIKSGATEDLNASIWEQINRSNVENEFLAEAISRFGLICPRKIELSLVDSRRPFRNAFLASESSGSQRIAIDRLGSGYEMMFAILWAFYLSRQSGKNLIILIDEPELRLHPKLQEQFVELLLEFSETAQIILASHSPMLVKDLMGNNYTQVKRITNNHEVVEAEGRVLPYPSAGEINFLAFDMPTPGYHTELYEQLFSQSPEPTIKGFDGSFLVGQNNLAADYPWKGSPNEVSLLTHVRNQIHHPSNLGNPGDVDIRKSIESMRAILK